jgi:hypothetical protein
MSFVAHCPYCSTSIRAADHATGLSVECPRCRSFFTVVPAARATAKTTSMPWSRPPAKTAPVPVPEPRPVALPPVDPYGHIPLARADSAPLNLQSGLPAPPILGEAEEQPALPHSQLEPFGVLGLLLGSGALVCASVPGLAFLTLALGAIGLILGGIGLVHGRERSRAARLVARAGSLVSFLVVAVALLWPGLLGPFFRLGGKGMDPDQDRHRAIRLARAGKGGGPLTVAKGPPGATGGADWVDARRAAVQVNDVRVMVVSAGVASVLLQSKDQRRVSEQKFLVIRLLVSNVGAGRAIPFRGWGGTAARLTDNGGTSYPHASFGPAEQVLGQVGKEIKVFWGATAKATDVLVFSAPPEQVTWLYLELPGTACASPGVFRLAIPADMIRR